MADDTPSWQAFFDSCKQAMNFKIHPAGWPFILIATVVTCFALVISGSLGLLFIGLTAAVALFFRDPVRATPSAEGLVISPANGKVVMITEGVMLPEDLEGRLDTTPSFTRISIFLSVFNVHVNRVPVSGTVVSTKYHEGKFFNAALDKASLENERCSTLFKTTGKDGAVDVAITQIAGWVARRIVNDLLPGQTVQSAQHLGIIRFGSRVDVYLPDGVAPAVCVGQTVIEGETVLANLLANDQTAPAAKVV